jgi:predicted CoA-binding protein
MSTLQEAVDDFLSQERIAVAGVSRTKGEAANIVYKKLRGSGYRVFAVNPSAETVEGDPCYADLSSIPDGVTAVVIATHPRVAAQVVRECAALGVRKVWMHRSFGQGSVSEEAIDLCREEGITAIPGGCPMMYCKPVDPGHKCLRWLLRFTGRLPQPIAEH